MKLMKKIIVSVMVAAVLIGTMDAVPLSAASAEKTDGKNMKKVITYFGKKQYKKAATYNKRLSEKAKEKCVDNMSAGMKKAYLKKVKRYSTELSTDGSPYLWAYYLTDIDNDKQADLLIKSGTCEADVKLDVYTYKNKKLKHIGSKEAFHSGYYAYPMHNGIVEYGGMMGEEWMNLVTIVNGKLKTKKIGTRIIDVDEWFSVGCSLDTHISYDSNYKSIVDYSDLK